jgi:hypothetical protein
MRPSMAHPEQPAHELDHNLADLYIQVQFNGAKPQKKVDH